MNKTRINIAIIEPSDIIYEGIFNLLMKENSNLYINRLTSIREIEVPNISGKLSAVIINPLMIQNKTKELRKIKKELKDILWIGLIYMLFEDSLLENFNYCFKITEPFNLLSSYIRNLNKQQEYCDGKQDLSDRETEVLAQLTRGLSTKEIADKLNISIHTVITHRKNISEKTGIKSIAGLTIFAISQKLIPVDFS